MKEHDEGKVLRCRLFRQRHRISLSELAAAAGVSVQRISQLELMERPLTPHGQALLRRAIEAALLHRRAGATAALREYLAARDSLFVPAAETEGAHGTA